MRTTLLLAVLLAFIVAVVALTTWRVTDEKRPGNKDAKGRWVHLKAWYLAMSAGWIVFGGLTLLFMSVAQ